MERHLNNNSPCLLDHGQNPFFGDLVIGKNANLAAKIWHFQQAKAPISHELPSASVTIIETVRFWASADQSIGRAVFSPSEVVDIAFSGAAPVGSLGTANCPGVFLVIKGLIVESRIEFRGSDVTEAGRCKSSWSEDGDSVVAGEDVDQTVKCEGVFDGPTLWLTGDLLLALANHHFEQCILIAVRADILITSSRKYICSPNCDDNYLEVSEQSKR